ncbi:MAG: Flp pilus assembly protein CpaB, partial [Pseudomonadota bacterium]
RSAFFVGEPIRESKIVRAGKGYMSAILPAGQQAIATSISTATSAGGFILPNDRVDVIMTRRAEEDEGGNFITETVLENVRVLAIDQTIEEKDGESVVVGETATLQLSPDQAKILTVAQQMADRLSLALRSLEDIGNEETKGAEYLLSGNRGNGRVRVIKYGNRKEILAGSNTDAAN